MTRRGKLLAALTMAVMAAGSPLAVRAREPAAKAATAYAWPTESTRLVDGPGVDKAQIYCLACHSADYVNTQPRGMPEAFWAGEVNKMRQAYGAPMSDDDAKAIVKYLSATYGAGANAR